MSLSDAELIGAKLTWWDLSFVDLEGAKLNGAKLNGTDLDDADLSGADLSGADLSGADLNGVDLTDANLTEAGRDGDAELTAGYAEDVADLRAILRLIETGALREVPEAVDCLDTLVRDQIPIHRYDAVVRGH